MACFTASEALEWVLMLSIDDRLCSVWGSGGRCGLMMQAHAVHLLLNHRQSSRMLFEGMFTFSHV